MNHTSLELSLVGAKIRALRLARNEKMQTVADELDISCAVISLIENGRYRSLKMTTLVELCNYFQIPLNEVLSQRIIS